MVDSGYVVDDSCDGCNKSGVKFFILLMVGVIMMMVILFKMLLSWYKSFVDSDDVHDKDSFLASVAKDSNVGSGDGGDRYNDISVDGKVINDYYSIFYSNCSDGTEGDDGHQ